jgi:ribonuclease Z
VWLFDCGEGTQHQLLRSDIRSSQISKIFITHLHGDHIFGLMGLLASCGLAGSGQAVELYGPSGLKQYIAACAKYAYINFRDRVQVHEVNGGLVYEDEGFKVEAQLLKHRVPAYGYRIAEHDSPGEFNVTKAKALGIAPGPIYGELKQGKVIALDDGRKINGKDLCGATQPGRKLVYCTDTVFCEAAIELSQGVDVLIHEATFAHQDADMAFDRLHSTTTMAAQVALAAQVKQLIMTHFSPRYGPGNGVTLEDLKREAQAIFPNTVLAYDFFDYEIDRPKVT